MLKNFWQFQIFILQRYGLIGDLAEGMTCDHDRPPYGSPNTLAGTLSTEP
jgi:hypothetical protein